MTTAQKKTNLTQIQNSTSSSEQLPPPAVTPITPIKLLPLTPGAPSPPVKLPFKTWEGAQEIPVNLLVFCDWNANEMTSLEFAELMSEIQGGGFDETIQVVPITKGPNTGKFLVLSGEHRTKAMIALDYKTVPAVVKMALAAADEETLMLWATKRNNIRGRINADKFSKIAQQVSSKRKISVATAQQQMLARAELVKKLANKSAPLALAPPTPTPRKPNVLTVPTPRAPAPAPVAKAPESPDSVSSDADDDLDTTDDEDAPSAPQTVAGHAERQRMLANLHTLEQTILSEHGDTIEHGYLFFGQSGKQHLVVEEEAHLYKLLEQMAAVCRRNSASMNEFLISAIKNELPSWE